MNDSPVGCHSARWAVIQLGGLSFSPCGRFACAPHKICAAPGKPKKHFPAIRRGRNFAQGAKPCFLQVYPLLCRAIDAVFRFQSPQAGHILLFQQTKRHCDPARRLFSFCRNRFPESKPKI